MTEKENKKLLKELTNVNFNIVNTLFSRTYFEEKKLENLYLDQIKISEKLYYLISNILIITGYLLYIFYIYFALYSDNLLKISICCLILSLFIIMYSFYTKEINKKYFLDLILIMVYYFNIVFKIYYLIFVLEMKEPDYDQELIRTYIYAYTSSLIFIHMKLESSLFIYAILILANIIIIVLIEIYSIKNHFFIFEGVCSIIIGLYFLYDRKKIDLKNRIIFSLYIKYENLMIYTDGFVDGINSYHIKIQDSDIISSNSRVLEFVNILIPENEKFYNDRNNLDFDYILENQEKSEMYKNESLDFNNMNFDLMKFSNSNNILNHSITNKKSTFNKIEDNLIEFNDISQYNKNELIEKSAQINENYKSHNNLINLSNSFTVLNDKLSKHNISKDYINFNKKNQFELKNKSQENNISENKKIKEVILQKNNLDYQNREEKIKEVILQKNNLDYQNGEELYKFDKIKISSTPIQKSTTKHNNNPNSDSFLSKIKNTITHLFTSNKLILDKDKFININNCNKGNNLKIFMSKLFRSENQYSIFFKDFKHIIKNKNEKYNYKDLNLDLLLGENDVHYKNNVSKRGNTLIILEDQNQKQLLNDCGTKNFQKKSLFDEIYSNSFSEKKNWKKNENNFFYFNKYESYDKNKDKNYLNEIFDEENYINQLYKEKSNFLNLGIYYFDLYDEEISLDSLDIKDLKYKKQPKKFFKIFYRKLNFKIINNSIEDIIFYDVTEQYNSQFLLRQENFKKRKIIEKLANEFKTSINTIIGLTNYILESKNISVEEEQNKYLNCLINLPNYLIFLISDIINFTNFENVDELKIKKEKINLKEIIYFCYNILKSLLHCSKNKSHKIETFLNFEEILEKSILFTDQIKLKQILLNLLSNAVKFTHSGKIGICCEKINEQNKVKISIIDSGIGIRDELKDKLFEDFNLLEKGIYQELQVSGLGLSITLKLCKKLDILFDFESKIDKGSIFSIYLNLKSKFYSSENLKVLNNSNFNSSNINNKDQFIKKNTGESKIFISTPQNKCYSHKEFYQRLMTKKNQLLFRCKVNLHFSIFEYKFFFLHDKL